MSNYRTKSISSEEQSQSKLSDYAQLVKMKLTLMVVVSSILAYAIAAGSAFNLKMMLWLGIGGFLVSAAANSLNQVLEKDFDLLMDRTKNRPLPAGRMKSSEAVFAAGMFSVLGVGMLSLINPLTGLISMISMLIYAFLYTPLKRHSTISVAVGAIPGALPVLIGCVAAEGSISFFAMILFGIQFLWQFPHFWAIGYVGKEDYEKAGYKLLPIEDGKIDRKLGLHSSLYAIMLVLLVGSMYWMTALSFLAVTTCLLLSLIYLAFSINFHRNFDRKSALALMFSSFAYLPFVLLAILFF